MLGRLLKSVFSASGSARSGAEPTAEQLQVLQQALDALAASDMPRVVERLSALRRAGSPSAHLHRTIGSELGLHGHLDLARQQLEAAVSLDGTHAGAWADLGNVHRLAGRPLDAERCYQRALAIDPGAMAVSVGLAMLEASDGRTERALGRLAPLAVEQGDAAAVECLTQLLDRCDRAGEAKLVCEQVLECRPDHGAAHAALGYILLKREYRPEDALVHFERALASGYRSDQLYSNRGIALQDLGRLDEALSSYDAALALSPGHPLARFHRSLACLMRGDFGAGWPDYEARLASVDRQGPPRDLPVWDAESTRDTVFVYGEQGIGDEIMFASCMPDVIRLCPSVVLACSDKLQRLFQRSFPATKVITLAEARDPASPCLDAARKTKAIGSLPLHFRRERQAFPDHRGYLQADPQLVEEYRARLHDLGPGPRIGLSWRGGTDISRRALRSLGSDELKALLAVPGVRFVNLQYDCKPGDPEFSLLTDLGMVHWQDALDDYDRTAALVASLDQVVSVCTAVIHLAGALGRPTLVMAPFSPEWRYGIAGSAMPWYPAVRIERQTERGNWEPVIAAACDRLRALGEHAAR